MDYQYDKGLAKGIAEGDNKKAIEIAGGLLTKPPDTKTISIAIGLAISEIQKLKARTICF